MYKYKYKYKYGFMGPETRNNQRLTSERNSFIFQRTPPPIEGEPDIRDKSSIFYTEKDGGGDSFELRPGQRVNDLGEEWRKKIASIYVGANSLVILYEDLNFRGSRITMVGPLDPTGEIEGDMWNLDDELRWENRASSIQVVKA
jgi:hypothetical protein